MKQFVLLMVACALASSAVAAEWRVTAPPSWTAETGDPEPAVSVNSWYTENGVTITSSVFIGPLLPGQVRALNANAFAGTGRTICANAWQEIVGQTSTRVQSVPDCHTFPFFALVPATIVFAP